MTADTRRVQSTPAASATFAVGQLVKISRQHGVIDRRGMTSELLELLPHRSARVRLTATWQAVIVPVADLEPVERGVR